MMRLKRWMAALSNPREWLRGSMACVLSLLLVGGLSTQLQCLVSETASLPQHYFLVFRNIKPTRHDYTVVFSPWYGRKIIKQIVGQAGDRLIWDKEGTLWINDLKIGEALNASKSYRPLNPIGAQIIPKGYVFLWSPHPRSFDSRYQECALIRTSELGGWVIPLR